MFVFCVRHWFANFGVDPFSRFEVIFPKNSENLAPIYLYVIFYYFNLHCYLDSLFQNPIQNPKYNE